MLNSKNKTCERTKTSTRGYLQEMDWLERMSKRFTQHKCQNCGLFHIWKRPTTVHQDNSTNKKGKL